MNRLRDFDLSSVRSNEFGSPLLNEATQVANLVLLRFWYRDWINERGGHRTSLY